MVEVHEGELDVSPRDAGYDGARLSLLQASHAQLVETGRVQGSGFLMARGGKVFAHRTLGRRSHEPDSGPLLPDAIKDIGSITKVMTATAVMKLVEDGVLWLHQPVATIIPELKNPQHGSITLWHLLTHTSGLVPDPGYYAEPAPLDTFGQLQKEDWLTKVVLAGAPRFRPGEQWAYCTAGYVVLAEVVARASGRPYDEYVQAEIFGPLKMSRSHFAIPERLWPEVAWVKSRQLEIQQALHGGAPAVVEGGPAGGWGAYSTLHDLFKLGQCFLDGGTRDGQRILGRKTVEEMVHNQLSGVPAFHWGHRLKDFRYGLGWGFYSDGAAVGPATFHHAGQGWSSLYVDPVEHFVFVSFFQDTSAFDPALMVQPVGIAFSGIM